MRIANALGVPGNRYIISRYDTKIWVSNTLILWEYIIINSKLT